MANDVVAHFRGGTVVKGTSLNVDPTKPLCHIRTSDGRMLEVALANLKALYFVRDLTGNPARQEEMTADPTDPRLRGSHRIELRFRDGECLVGLTNRCPPRGPFFFLLPVDPKSNNTRILVNSAEVVSMQGPGTGGAVSFLGQDKPPT